ncbi:MAG: hypothetical protein ABEK59_02830 [Halobacteria archaeon]
MAQRYYFTALAPVNFVLGGKRYSYYAGDIFSETKERAERIMESQYAQNLRLTGRDEEEPETEKKEPAGSITLPEENLATDSHSNDEHPQTQKEEPEPEKPEQQQKPEPEKPEQQDEPEEGDVQLDLEPDPHWTQVKSYLNDLLQQDPVDEPKVRKICRLYGHEQGYKAIREACNDFYQT